MRRRILECMELVGSVPSKYTGKKTYVSTGALDCDHINYEATVQVLYKDRPSRANLVAESGDILFAKMYATKKTLRLDETTKEHLFSTGFCAVRANRSVISPELLYYVVSSDQFLSQKDKHSSGATQKAITNTGLGKILMQIPVLSEQPRIVAVLDKLTSLISLRKQQLAKLEELVKSQFVKLFGDINVNDRGWRIRPLGKLCTIVRGGSPRPIEQYLGGDVPWIKIGDATEGENIYLHSTKEHIIQEGVKKSRIVKAGSLIFANCGVSLGFARIITFDGCIHDGWLAMEDVDPCLDKLFLLQSLNQMTEHFRKIAPSGTQPNLNTVIMKSYMQVIPPMKLQQEFISFVEQIDKSKLTIQQSLDKLETLKKSLMQQYFKGDM